MVEKVNIASDNAIERQVSLIKQIFPQIIIEGKVDFTKLKELLGDIEEKEDLETYRFIWNGRANAFRNLQASALGTLIPDKEESIEFDASQNLFLEGDNLEILKLIQGHYFEKIKLIFIDPPYNTGKNFIYPDNFRNSISNYLKQTGQSEDGGQISTNVETSGRYHSDWISMMYPRLFLSRNLLRNDGIIFITIDDNEIHNLKRMMDDIYGEDNFIGTIIWNSTKSVTNTALISVSHTYIVIYAKNIEYFREHREHFRLPDTKDGFSNPDNDPRGDWKADPFQVGGERPNQMYEIINPNTHKHYKPSEGNSWKNDYETFQKLLADNRIVFGKDGKSQPQRKRFWSEAEERGKVTKTWWDEKHETTTNATMALKALMGAKVFDNPKPVSLLQRIIELGTISGDEIVMDFFAGSGTTAEAVLEMNKNDGKDMKFILVQLPEPTEPKSIAYKNGYKNIADIAKERIRRVIARIQRENAEKLVLQKNIIGFKVFKLNKSNFRSVQLEEFKRTGDEQAKQQYINALETWVNNPIYENSNVLDVVYEIILKERFNINSEIEDVDLGTNRFYKIIDRDVMGELTGDEMYVSLDSAITSETVQELLSPDYQNKKVIIEDRSLSDGDKLTLTNTINLKVL
ncbi:MAG TPA: site-specific DNA-methyltransferase [Candidatus Lokiarchaeia archaeon]|nr:site-specific DNA-methyltransferase [Candidatus Lokiarchaeia archaeon]